VEPTLHGVAKLIGKDVAWQQRLNQCDAVRLALGATRLMSKQRRNEIRSMIQSALADASRSGIGAEEGEVKEVLKATQQGISA
jgi:hypothetical protein